MVMAIWMGLGEWTSEPGAEVQCPVKWFIRSSSPIRYMLSALEHTEPIPRYHSYILTMRAVYKHTVPFRPSVHDFGNFGLREGR